MFVADVGLVSYGIKLTGGWSHEANLLADDSILDARSDWVKDAKGHYFLGPDTGKPIPPGVQHRPAGYLNPCPRWIVLEGPEDGPHWSYERWRNALVSQLDKPYDYIGILDFVTLSMDDRNWRDESAWFCDEYATWAQEQGGYTYGREIPVPFFKLNPSGALLYTVGLGWRVAASRG